VIRGLHPVGGRGVSYGCITMQKGNGMRFRAFFVMPGVPGHEDPLMPPLLIIQTIAAITFHTARLTPKRTNAVHAQPSQRPNPRPS